MQPYAIPLHMMPDSKRKMIIYCMHINEKRTPDEKSGVSVCECVCEKQWEAVNLVEHAQMVQGVNVIRIAVSWCTHYGRIVFVCVCKKMVKVMIPQEPERIATHSISGGIWKHKISNHTAAAATNKIGYNLQCVFFFHFSLFLVNNLFTNSY